MSITRLGCRAFFIAIVVLPISLCAQAVTTNTPSNQSTATASQRLASSYQAPTPKEQFRRYMISAYGPLAFLRAGVAAGIERRKSGARERKDTEDASDHNSGGLPLPKLRVMG